MEKLVIEGGIPLKGNVEIIGAKNSAVALLPATLLSTNSRGKPLDWVLTVN